MPRHVVQKEVDSDTVPAPASGPRAASAGRHHRAPTSGHPGGGPRPPEPHPAPRRAPATRTEHHPQTRSVTRPMNGSTGPTKAIR
jgi:hypothetical protein